MKRILFTGGGSAGHVVPNLAIMRELRLGYELLYMGTDGIERRLVQEAGYPFFEVNCPKLVRSLTLSNLTIPFALHRAKKSALRILERERPALVFSKGGFASYPAVWAAHRLGIPVFTHESDLSPGLCTRLIAKRCCRVLTSFPETAERFSNGMCVGSPIRREVLGGERTRALHKLGLSEKKPVLLVFGGGSGSRAINDAVTAALPGLLERFSILHIVGSNAARQTKADGYISVPYLADMGSAYAAADLVLCRAGSNTVFELMALKKPAVLVPLVRGSRGDQLENARYFSQRGLAVLLPERELFHLEEVLTATLVDQGLRARLAASDYPSATPAIVRLIRTTVG